MVPLLLTGPYFKFYTWKIISRFELNPAGFKSGYRSLKYRRFAPAYPSICQ